MRWTAEEDRQLATLAAEGLSASKIAEILGRVSRNSVIGRCQRTGIQLKGNRPSELRRRATRQHRARRKPWAPLKAKLAAVPLAIIEPWTGLDRLPNPVSAEPIRPMSELPDSGMVFIDLPDNPYHPRFCRFISDAEAAAPILTRRCCGGATVNGTSYCAAHAHLAIDRKRTKQSSERAKRRDAA